MRFRVAATVAVAGLAVAGLAGCQSNVGTALVVGGTRISESDVNSYVTPNAQPVAVSADSSGSSTYQVAPKTIVVQTLIDDRLYTDLLKLTPDGMPSGSKLATYRQQVLQGETPAKFLATHELKGFTARFAEAFVQREVLSAALGAAQSAGVDFDKLLPKLKVDVSVSPRYGKWDRSTLSILSPDANAALPGFVTFSGDSGPAS